MHALLAPAELAIFEFGRGFGMDVHSAAEIARTLEDLNAARGNALIAGGIAVIHHGYRRYTHDVDILYANTDEFSLLKRLQKNFKLVLKAKNGWHHLEHRKTRVRLELIPEGGLTNYGFIPGPAAVGGEQGCISLRGLVWLKLVSGRIKDIADLVELAKIHGRKFSSVREQLPSELQPRFTEIEAQAEKEMASDPNHSSSEDADRAKERPAEYGKRPRAKRTQIQGTKSSKA